MLGSVFNQHQASTSSEPSRTKLRTFKVGKDTIPFSEFRGLGSPGLNIGLSGDIYIDVTPGLHALYARYPQRWLLWPGPTRKDESTLLLHPVHSNRCLWCNNDSIGWFFLGRVKINPCKLHFWRRKFVYLSKYVHASLAATASEVLAETLKCQATVLEESKKRKREAQVHQPIRTNTFPTTSTNISSLSQDRTSLENQTRTDIPSFLHSTISTIPTSQPEIMIPGPTTAPIIQSTWQCSRS